MKYCALFEIFFGQRVHKVASTLNDFFSSIVTSMNLPESQNADPLSDNIDHPTLKAIMKWRNHPSALAITAVQESRERFAFSSVTLADVAKEINILKAWFPRWYTMV